MSALLQRRAGDDCAPQGPIRDTPAPAGVAAIGQSLVTKRDKGRRGKEKKRRKKKERKKAQTAVTDRLGERRGSSCPRQAGLPLRLGPLGRVEEGRTGWRETALPGDWPRGGERTERGACCHLAGRAVFWPLGMSPGRVLPPRTSSPLLGTARAPPSSPTPRDKLSDKAKVPKANCWTVIAQ